MKKLAGILMLAIALSGCKIETKKGGSNTGGGGGGGDSGGQMEKGGSIPDAQRFFESPPAPITANNLDGLWRQREGNTEQGYYRREALVFKGGSSMLFAVECQKLGLTVYSMVRVPIQKVRDQITVTKTGGYEATEKDEKSATKLTCPALMRKGSMYFSFKDFQTMCLSTRPDCQGRRSEWMKIRDDI